MRKLALLLVFAAACDDPKRDHAPGPGEHVHRAPHGGTLVELGDHFAQVEFVVDRSAGTMTAYVLDGEAEKPVRIAQKTMDVTLVGAMLTLTAVSNPLTGEKEGDTSEFRGQSESLRGARASSGMLERVTVRGRTFDGVAFVLRTEGAR